MTKGHRRSLALWIKYAGAIAFVLFGSTAAAVMGVL
jgi:hypothetical protein